MADISETEKAYAAGLFDGEGCVQLYMKKTGIKNNGQKNRSLTTSLSVAGVDMRPLEWLQERYAGSLRITQKNGPSQKCFLGIWTVFSFQAEHFANDIFPYTIVKREQLELWLEARTMVYQRGWTGSRGLPDDEVVARREIVARVKALKRVG